MGMGQGLDATLPTGQGADPMIGSWIQDQYLIVGFLGQGGMGKIYLAEQPSMGRTAAIKVISRLDPAQTSMDEVCARFQKEAKAVSRLSHPHIVTVFNFGTLEDGRPFLAMEYVNGVSLSALVREEGPLEPLRALNVVYQVGSALEYAHSRKIVHRDLKPHNVMLTKLLGRDHAKVLDFGTARVQDEFDNSSTKTGDLVGTPCYMSPEQCKGTKVTAQADQYALGLLFYELLVGTPPFVADTLYGYLRLHQHVTPDRPSSSCRGAGLEVLDDIVLRMLAKEPSARYPGMAAVLLALEEASNRLRAKQELRDVLRWAAMGEDLAGRPAQNQSRSSPGAMGLRAPVQVSTSAGSGRGMPSSTLLRGSGGEPRRLTVSLVDPRHRMLKGRAGQALRRLGIFGEPVAGNELRSVGDFIEAAFAKGPPELLCIAVRPEELDEVQAALGTRGPAACPVLLCVDAPVARVAEILRQSHAPNLLIGQHPCEAASLALAVLRLSGVGSRELSERLSGADVSTLKVNTLAQHNRYVDYVMEDLRARRIGRQACDAARDLADELTSNAIVHNSERAGAAAPPTTVAPAESVQYSLEEPATLVWSVGERFTSVAAIDPYGALEPAHVMRAFEGQRRAEDGNPIGLGIPMLARRSSHLMFFLTPGVQTEVLTLVERVPAGRLQQRRSLVLLALTDTMKTRPGSMDSGRGRQIGQRLWLYTDSSDGAVNCHLRGEINQTCSLDELFAQGKNLSVNLSQVTAINNMGVRAWIAARGRNEPERLTLTECSAPVVHQMNLVPAFRAGCHLASVVLNFTCPRCGADSSSVITIDPTAEQMVPAVRCPDCRGEMVADEVLDEYFNFLEH